MSELIMNSIPEQEEVDYLKAVMDIPKNIEGYRNPFIPEGYISWIVK